MSINFYKIILQQPLYAINLKSFGKRWETFDTGSVRVNEMGEKGGSTGLGIEMNDFLTGGTGDAAYPLTLTSIGFQLYLRSP